MSPLLLVPSLALDVPSTECTGAFTCCSGSEFWFNGLQAPLPFKRACICQIMTGVQVLQAVLLVCICDSSNTLSG